MRPSTARALLLLVPSACSNTSLGVTQIGTDGGADASRDVSDAEMGRKDGTVDGNGAVYREAGEPGDDAAARMDGAFDGNGAEASADAGSGCFLNDVGVYGKCVTTSACAALGNHTFHASVSGYCSGPADIGCCTRTPSVADNPPIPVGWKLLPQSAVTPDITTWAISILKAPTTYPMFSTTLRTFGSLVVQVRVEWLPPDFQNNTVHRGVTLYEPS